jgi:hypothetical protein
MFELRPHACGERARAALVSRIVPSAEALWFTPSLASTLAAPQIAPFSARASFWRGTPLDLDLRNCVRLFAFCYAHYQPRSSPVLFFRSQAIVPSPVDFRDRAARDVHIVVGARVSSAEESFQFSGKPLPKALSF